jgi:hypothetical protein
MSLHQDSNDSSSRLPKLDMNGKNWILWDTEVHAYIVSKSKLRRHIEGCALVPKMPVAHPADEDKLDGPKIQPTEEEQEAYKTELDEWHQREQLVKHILFQTLPPVLKLKITMLSAHDAWSLIHSKFRNAGALSQADIISQMHSVCAAKNEDP